jgi:ubiquinone/menaquinone biosynthesis C-methylase UbiE
VLRCVRCHASLAGWRERRESFACPACGAAIRVDAIALDVVPERPAPRAFGERAMQSGWLAKLYDRWWRPLTFGVSTALGAPSAREEARHALGLLAGRRGPWLDLSCGTGTLTRPFVDAIGAGEVVGLDVSRAMLAKARASVPGAALVRADAADLPFDDGVFGAVANMAALDLYPDPARVVSEAARVLASGGRWVVSAFVTGAPLPLDAWSKSAGLSRFGQRSFRRYLIAWADKD